MGKTVKTIYRGMTAIEHKELKGITVKNMFVTVISTASIVASVMTTYFNLKSDVSDLRARQETTDRVNEIRLKVLESQVNILQQQVQEIKYNKTQTPKS
jgi:sensor domain CHASE-containing protein